jgi:3-oxoacyl-[acyl-carrier protein] reductase
MNTRLPTNCSAAQSLETNTHETVLVTGGSGGIGRALCLAFARAGWTVGVHYFSRPDEAATTLALVRNMSPRSGLYQADIRLQKEVRAMVELFIKEHGHLHTMICNAGTAGAHFVLRHRPDEWRRVIDTNLTGTFHCIQAAAATMVTTGGGSLIVIGSYAGTQGDTGQAAYASAKAGLLGLVRTAGLEWGPFNIRINLVYPGRHRTSLETAEPAGPRLKDHLLGRSPNLEEVARTICHLAQLKDISGQVWNLDSRLV